MSIGNSNKLPLETLLPAAVAFGAGWLGDWIFDGGSLLRQAACASLCALAVAGVCWWLNYRKRCEEQACRNYFEALCRVDPQSVPADTAHLGLPRPPKDPLWKHLGEMAGERLLQLYRRIEDLEHARAAWEVRCLRAGERAEQMEQALAALAEPILAVDEHDRLLFANRGAAELFQLDMDAALGKVLSEVLHCRQLAQLLLSTRRHRSALARTEEIEITDASGRGRCFKATAMNLSASHKGAQHEGGALVMLRDFSDQKNLQKRNAEFVSAVSHEMKTPLAGIKAYVELLADGDVEDEATREEFLQIINSQADRLQRLVDNLLNLARIEAGVVQVSKQPRSLNELLEEALRVVQPTAEAKQIQLVADLSPLYLGVLVDRDMMLQAAINLLSNAVKYTPNGGRVTLRSRLTDEQARFEVEDTGVGLSEEDCRRIFEKFYRVQKDKNMAQGTGLGLPLAKHIVEDVHGGRLTVESKLGQGSTFIVTLPLAGHA